MIYGTPSGLSAEQKPDQFWTQDSIGVADAAERGDSFGYVLATGDFNNDGYDDLAISVGYESLGSRAAAGAVHVLYGSRSGITSNNSQIWTQDSPGIKGSSNAYDVFGSALAAGDFDGDGFDDLAIGVPYDSVNSLDDAGAVNVLYGSRSGLTDSPDQLFTQNSENVEGRASSQDHFGFSLVAGNFNGDRYDDLAIGVPDEGFDGTSLSGSVNVIYGSPRGLSATTILPDQIWSQNSFQPEELPEYNDKFGWSLAAGDLNRDGFHDLVVGVPYEDVGVIRDAGAVHIIFGSRSGLSETSILPQTWTQNSPSIQSDCAIDELFGLAVVTGDFNRDGYDDLAAGVPQESPKSVHFAGAANVIYGGSGGLTSTGNQLWHQDSNPGVPGILGTSDLFGIALATGDYNRDGFLDLAAGVPFDRPTGGTERGSVNIFYGSSEGLRSSKASNGTGKAAQSLTQDKPGVEDRSENGDRFGLAVSPRL